MKKVASPAPIGSFWAKLPRPFFVLAPMANVTDVAFRSVIAKYGKPDVMWNEFVSADGLCSPGRERLLFDLKFSEKERPIVAQLFTGHPEAMRKAAALCAELGYDGLDINMGCPDRAVEKQGGGSGMIKDPASAVAVLQAAREGWVSGKITNATLSRLQKGENIPAQPPELSLNNIPVSVKTRIGYNRVEMDWLRLLLEQKLPALTVHLRTRKEMSDVPAHWELMPEIVKLRDEVQADLPLSERTRIIGNGDVESIADGTAKIKKSGCDGVMIGRGIFGAPWFFENCSKGTDARPRTPEERLKIMVEHTKLFQKTFCGKNGEKGLKNFAVMKKHFKAYVSGWDGAKELRVKLMETENASQVDKIIKEYLKQ
jgi:tRNA-dihydrouridine synthase